jgi:hypothetical protein
MAPELALARLAACCVHPAAAWNRLTPGARTLVVGAYVVASYLAVLGILLLVE